MLPQIHKLIYCVINTLLFFALFFFYPWITHGFSSGTIIGLLTWSFYILCIPARHGRYIIGSWLTLFGIKLTHIEPYVLMFSLTMNIVSLVVCQYLYRSTYFTQLLWRIITKPNPYWLMIVISSIGTLYYFLVGIDQHQRENRFKMHMFIRGICVIIGVISFFFFIWNDAVILLNHVA